MEQCKRRPVVGSTETVNAWCAYRQDRDTYLGVSDDIMKAHTLVLKMSWPET